MKEYEDRLALLGLKETERLQINGVERVRHLSNKIEAAEKQLRDRTEDLRRIKGRAAQKASKLAIHQETKMQRVGVRLTAATVAANTVREFADGLLRAQGCLANHASLLRDYTARLIRQVHVRVDAYELFATESPMSWLDDPIAQSSIQTCEEIIAARTKLEGIDVPGQYDETSGFPKAWSAIVLEWETLKGPSKESLIEPERISESDLRSILAKQRCVKPHEVTEDQIKRAALEFCHHYETFQMIPATWTDLPLPNYKALCASARPDSAFWKERENEFRQHSTGENVMLGAWFLSNVDWTFFSGGDMKSPSPETVRIFKALARQAVKGLGSAQGSESWIKWLELLSCAEDESTGKRHYKVTEGSSYADDAALERDGEESPQNAFVEYRLMPDGKLRQGKRWYTRTPRIENLFAKSADQCLELRSLVIDNASPAPPNPTGDSQSGNRRTSVEQESSRRELVETFLKRCNAVSADKISKADIWRSVGHRTPRQFEYWQAGEDRPPGTTRGATRQDDQNFRRVLSMQPETFLSERSKRQLR